LTEILISSDQQISFRPEKKELYFVLPKKAAQNEIETSNERKSFVVSLGNEIKQTFCWLHNLDRRLQPSLWMMLRNDEHFSRVQKCNKSNQQCTSETLRKLKAFRQIDL